MIFLAKKLKTHSTMLSGGGELRNFIFLNGLSHISAYFFSAINFSALYIAFDFPSKMLGFSPNSQVNSVRSQENDLYLSTSEMSEV